MILCTVFLCVCQILGFFEIVLIRRFVKAKPEWQLNVSDSIILDNGWTIILGYVSICFYVMLPFHLLPIELGHGINVVLLSILKFVFFAILFQNWLIVFIRYSYCFHWDWAQDWEDEWILIR